MPPQYHFELCYYQSDLKRWPNLLSLSSHPSTFLHSNHIFNSSIFSSLLFCHYLNHSTLTIPMRLQDSCHTSTCTIKDVLILTDKEIWFSCAIMWQNIFRSDSANPVTFDFTLRDTFKIIFSFHSSDHLETFTLKIAALMWFLLRFALQ